MWFLRHAQKTCTPGFGAKPKQLSQAAAIQGEKRFLPVMEILQGNARHTTLKKAKGKR
jgi:hypothetical protein